MGKREITKVALGATLLAAPAAGLAQSWVPGAEITGQSVQVETNGVVNTVYFDPGGAARIITPAGNVVQGNWTAAGGQLCLQTGTGRECWPYNAAFQAGQQVTLVSSCQVSSMRRGSRPMRDDARSATAATRVRPPCAPPDTRRQASPSPARWRPR